MTSSTFFPFILPSTLTTTTTTTTTTTATKTTPPPPSPLTTTTLIIATLPYCFEAVQGLAADLSASVDRKPRQIAITIKFASNVILQLKVGFYS